MDHSSWLQKQGWANYVSSEEDEPASCHYCGVLTDTRYMVWDGTGQTKKEAIFADLCFSCARELLGIEAGRHPLADKVGEYSRTS